MFEVISSAVIEYLLDRLPASRRGRLILWIVMAASVAVAAAALIVLLSG